MSSFDSPELLQALDDVEKGNYEEALRLLLPAASSGNPKAQCNLATLYQFGWGVPVDIKKCVELYLAVAVRSIREEHLSAIAYQNLATIYTTGLAGLEPDREKASDYSLRSKELGLGM